MNPSIEIDIAWALAERTGQMTAIAVFTHKLRLIDPGVTVTDVRDAAILRVRPSERRFRDEIAALSFRHRPAGFQILVTREVDEDIAMFRQVEMPKRMASVKWIVFVCSLIGFGLGQLVMFLIERGK